MCSHWSTSSSGYPIYARKKKSYETRRRRSSGCWLRGTSRTFRVFCWGVNIVRLSMEKEKRKEAALQARFVALEANVEFLRGQNSGLEGQLSMLRLLHHSRPNKSPSLEYLVDKLYTTTDKKDS
eukprot:TRINITY_DN6456_c0_g1_i2.p2 TRINITY_DN6456_c0_g1~~TRINITY_DN6456_c0_g1_i2.p2  ORF type:complete len:124 (-),score=9.49 TRINITY_DN6456_c0_g1_i2:31-402(-)